MAKEFDILPLWSTVSWLKPWKICLKLQLTLLKFNIIDLLETPNAITIDIIDIHGLNPHLTGMLEEIVDRERSRIGHGQQGQYLWRTRDARQQAMDDAKSRHRHPGILLL